MTVSLVERIREDASQYSSFIYEDATLHQVRSNPAQHEPTRLHDRPPDASLTGHASHRLTNPTVWRPSPSKNVYISTCGSQDGHKARQGVSAHNA